MDDLKKKRERMELLLRFTSIFVSVASFWIIVLFGSYYNPDELELAARLDFAATMSWIVFLHMEGIGMLIMAMMKEKWRREAREEALRESREREEQHLATIRELRRRLARYEAEGADGGEGA